MRPCVSRPLCDCPLQLRCEGYLPGSSTAQQEDPSAGQQNSSHLTSLHDQPEYHVRCGQAARYSQGPADVAALLSQEAQLHAGSPVAELSAKSRGVSVRSGDAEAAQPDRTGPRLLHTSDTASRLRSLQPSLKL